MIQNQDVILEINGFQIDLTQEISRGAQGQIFACKSKQNTNQQFCAKIITILDDNQKFCKREKKIGEMISNNQKNPNLVAIYQIDQIEDKIVIIMERCEGNLHQLMEQKKFNDFEIFDFIQQFLNGYKTLYDLKIIHKDIKPENILIKNENGKIIYKITDFGISKIQENVGDKDITRQGTKAYSAPEVGLIIQDQEIQQNLSHIQDQSVIDIYSLGLMLYQLIFQKLPFQTKRIQIQRFFEETKKSPLKIKENTQYARLIEKMLLYNPQERYSFLELNQQLQQFKLQNDSQPEFKQVLNQNRPSILETEIEQNQNQENKNSIFNNQNDNKQQIYNSQQKLNCQFKPIKDNKQQLNQNQVNQNGNLQFQNDIKQQFNNNQQNNNLNFQPTKDNNQQFNSNFKMILNNNLIIINKIII
ncbi:unnamed protein product [Paramecium sonneborni]|uniref:Protein kinase domain-containing protein n=1 Tax=Paramecium sonneborni TaxID=65129 RepID=A0A8S1LVF5_9CILI|nr:unnamed protein product [Paramecium sonneborni]